MAEGIILQSGTNFQVIKNNKIDGHFYDLDKYFRFKQPLSYFVKVQLRVPPYVVTKTNKDFKFVDDHYGKESNYTIVEENGYYWVDITENTDTLKYTNNFVVSLKVTDNGGIKTIDLSLHDRNFSNLENLLFLASQAIYYRDNGTTIINSNIFEGEGSTKRKGINEVFVQATSLSNIRVKFGYNSTIEPESERGAESKNTPNPPEEEIYKDWVSFNKRRLDQTIRETPWITCMITALTRKISEDGGLYSITAKSEMGLLLDNIELEREFAILQESPYNMLNIVNDACDTFLQIRSHKTDPQVTIEKATKKGEKDKITVTKPSENLFGKISGKTAEEIKQLLNEQKINKNDKEDVITNVRKFFKRFYNPSFAVPEPKDLGNVVGPYNNSVLEINLGNGEKVYAEPPRNKWVIPSGGTSAIAAKIDYQLLDEPAELFSMGPRATLGTILNEIMSQIPPKRYLRRRNTVDDSYAVSADDVIEITDEMEQLFATYKGDISKAWMHKSDLKYSSKFKNLDDVSPYTIDENLNRMYRFGIVDAEIDTLNEGAWIGYDTTEGKTQKILYFYYGDIKRMVNQSDFRVYKARHPQSTVLSLDFTQENLFAIFSQEVDVKANLSRNRIKTYQDMVVFVENLKETEKNGKIANPEQAEEIKRQIQEMEDSIKEYKRKLEKNKGENSDKELLEKPYEVNIDKLNMGSQTLSGGNSSTFRTLSYAIAHKANLILLGDPFWFFDSVVVPAENVLCLEVYRSGSTLDSNGNKTPDLLKDILLSGYYAVLNITHDVGLNGFTTNLELVKMNSDLFKAVQSSRDEAEFK